MGGMRKVGNDGMKEVRSERIWEGRNEKKKKREIGGSKVKERKRESGRQGVRVEEKVKGIENTEKEVLDVRAKSSAYLKRHCNRTLNIPLHYKHKMLKYKYLMTASLRELLTVINFQFPVKNPNCLEANLLAIYKAW